MRVLVTGGAGYIGSVVTEQLVKGDHEVVVYDSLYKGHREAVVAGARLVEADLRDHETLTQTLRDMKCDAVIHMAADSLGDARGGRAANGFLFDSSCLRRTRETTD